MTSFTMASPEHNLFSPRKLQTPLNQANSLATGQTAAESSPPSLLTNHVLIEPLSLNQVDDQTSDFQPALALGLTSETGIPRPIKGGAPEPHAERNEPHPTSTPEDRDLTWGERLSKDGFWVFDYLQGIGFTKHLRELAAVEGIDFDAGLNELRVLGLLDERNLEYPKINLPKPKLPP